jgi:two-component system, OmpR family, sensor kinase
MTTAAEEPVRTVSLRRRVAAWVLLLLVAVLVGLGFLVHALLGDALKGDLQDRLSDRARYAVLLQEQGVTGQSLADKLTGDGVWADYSSGGQRWIGRDTGDGGRPHPGPGGPPARPAPDWTPTTTFAEDAGRLTATVGLRDGTLNLQTDEGSIAHTLSELRTIELAAGAGTVAVAGVALWFLVGAALRPLHRMTGLARRIRDGARGGRLRPTRPRTDLGRTALAFDEMLDSLETAESAAQAAEQRMRQFLADASHDLRTPLAGVIAGAEQLLRQPLGRMEREERLVAVVRQARRAARLVDDLLLMTRLEQDPDDERDVLASDLTAVLDAATAELELRHPRVRVRRQLDGPVWVTGAADGLHRAIGNVLDNAARADPAGVVDIDLHVADGTAVLRISDSGPGVPDDQRERIFDRFVRLADSRTGPGSGLGLPITRALLRRAGGDARCLPSDAGAVFELTLPVAVTPALGAPVRRELLPA